MRHWRVGLLIVLGLTPFVVLGGLGCYFLWERHWGFWAWWPMAACWALAYVLAWHWQRRQKLLGGPDFTAPLHWTERDRLAWQIVEARAKASAKLTPDQLSSMPFYLHSAQELALELARFYHPGAPDPLSRLTIPEILTVVELASHDMAELVDRYLPGGHLLTIKNWQQARRAADWYSTASNVYWLIAAVFAPIETGVRYAATKAGMSVPWQMLQQNLLVWFYTNYLHRLGTYLIELNSRRLRVGTRRYRELMQAHSPFGQAAPAATPAADAARPVTITLFGQVNAGKSSLINALLGEQRAHTDVLPATADITRYDVHPEGMASRMLLLDTVGYGHAGPKEDQLQATLDATRQSDLLLLVMHARSPARQADVDLLQALRHWFESHPDLKRPPILGVLTHIDLLSPALEWAPPYDWQQPQRPKEQQIHDAVMAVREQLGPFLAGCIPVCSAAGKTYGVEEWLLPAIVEFLDEARAVALLRCLRAEANMEKVHRLFRQTLQAGKELAKVFWQMQRKG
jgi:predicted GTPase